MHTVARGLTVRINEASFSITQPSQNKKRRKKLAVIITGILFKASV